MLNRRKNISSIMIDYKTFTKNNKEFEEFYTLKIANLTQNSMKSKTLAINKFLETIKNKQVKKIDKNDIITYIESPKFQSLKNSSKSLKLIHIKSFLKYFKRNDLVELFPEYKSKTKVLDKNSLISRQDLELLLKSCKGIREIMVIMVLFESAVRRDEFMNIRKRNIQFHENYVNLFIEISKTMPRNIPLVESVPYIKEFLNVYALKEDDLIFDFTENYMNALLVRINNKCKKKFPHYDKEITPHLFRHSRLTELASNRKLNEPQLRKFAGWSKNSGMPAIYFHLDDESIRNEFISQNGEEIEKPKRISFDPVRCPVCTEINNKFNEFCWKCGKIINEDLGVKQFKEQERFEKIERENKQLKTRLDKMEDELKRALDLF